VDFAHVLSQQLRDLAKVAPAYNPIHSLSNSAAFRLAMASRAVYVAKMVDAR